MKSYRVSERRWNNTVIASITFSGCCIQSFGTTIIPSRAWNTFRHRSLSFIRVVRSSRTWSWFLTTSWTIISTRTGLWSDQAFNITISSLYAWIACERSVWLLVCTDWTFLVPCRCFFCVATGWWDMLYTGCWATGAVVTWVTRSSRSRIGVSGTVVPV